MDEKNANNTLQTGPAKDLDQVASQQSDKKPEKNFQFKEMKERPDFYQDIDFEDLPKAAYAGFWIRFFAYMVDLLFASLISSILFNLTLYRLFSYEIAGSWWMGLLELIILLAYFSATTYFFQGQTLGKMLFGIRTLMKDGSLLDRDSLLLREVAGRAIINVVPIICVFLIFSKRRQHLVDSLVDTVVVNENQLEMLLEYQ